jgi:hypothetical protein
MERDQTTMQRKTLELKIEKALKRMELRGHKDTEGYTNLKNKLIAIKNGADYKITNVAEKMIGTYAAFIPSCNTMFTQTSTKLSMQKKLNEAVEYIKELWEQER